VGYRGGWGSYDNTRYIYIYIRNRSVVSIPIEFLTQEQNGHGHIYIHVYIYILSVNYAASNSAPEDGDNPGKNGPGHRHMTGRRRTTRCTIPRTCRFQHLASAVDTFILVIKVGRYTGLSLYFAGR
jgi:hypothetical protein